MAEELVIPTNSNKQERYNSLLPQIEALIADENDMTANLANIAAALKQGMGYFWVGFYLVKNNELLLGPFQGPVACTRISFGKGVCGVAWKERRTVLVPDVEEFPGHIACNSASKSEIVLPVFDNNEVVMVLDVDSEQLNDFDEIDEKQLTKLIQVIENKLKGI